MTKRIAAIIFIFVCTSIAWMILGGTISYRTYSTPTINCITRRFQLGQRTKQLPPFANYVVKVPVSDTKEVNGEKVETTKDGNRAFEVPLESTNAQANFRFDPRQKGLLWYGTYHVDFDGEISIPQSEHIIQKTSLFHFPCPRMQAQYDDISISLDGKPLDVWHQDKFVNAEATCPGWQQRRIERPLCVARTRPMDVQLRRVGEPGGNFQPGASTNFQDYDFAPNSLSPVNRSNRSGGADLTWEYKNLVSGYPIVLIMPQKLQPGPLVERISFFAPVSLFFFFFLLFILCTVRGVDLHPMHYFFLACTFFSFHVLLAYLADHISIHAAFAICSTVSIFLLVSYLRRVVNPKFAFRVAGLIQLIYLVLFSYAFFFEGFTGLSITIGAILTLFIVMQMTATVRWAEKLTVKPA